MLSFAKKYIKYEAVNVHFLHKPFNHHTVTSGSRNFRRRTGKNFTSPQDSLSRGIARTMYSTQTFRPGKYEHKFRNRYFVQDDNDLDTLDD